MRVKELIAGLPTALPRDMEVTVTAYLMCSC